MRKYLIEVRCKLFAAEPNKVVAWGVVETRSPHDAVYKLIQDEIGVVASDFWSEHYFDFVDVTEV